MAHLLNRERTQTSPTARVGGSIVATTRKRHDDNEQLDVREGEPMPTFPLIVPRWRPPLCNTWRGRHWSVAHRLRKQSTQLLGTYARLQHVPRATGRRRVSVEIVLAPRQCQPDRDAFDKLLLDALVGAGLLLDDGDRGLAGRVEVTFRRGTRDDWGTVLTFEDVPGRADRPAPKPRTRPRTRPASPIG